MPEARARKPKPPENPYAAELDADEEPDVEEPADDFESEEDDEPDEDDEAGVFASEDVFGAVDGVLLDEEPRLSLR
ncbi:hypothetical protein SALBM135S_00164 [Streptomyces alboniger]